MDIKKIIQNSIQIKEEMLSDKSLLLQIENAIAQITNCFQNKGKVFLCGNGGSAADAQHIAAELSGRFYFDRPPLFAEALHTNTSFLTAVANDYSFDEVYARMVEAVCSKNDVLIGLSTSGNSKNVVKSLKKAKEKKCFTIGLTGKTGGELKQYSDILVNVPSEDTARIQEVHILIGHIICQYVESNLFSNK